MKFEPKFYLDNSKLPETFVIMAVTCSDGRLKYSTGLKVKTKLWPDQWEKDEYKEVYQDLRDRVKEMTRTIQLYKHLVRKTNNQIFGEQIKQDFDTKFGRIAKAAKANTNGVFSRDADKIIVGMRNGTIKKPGTIKNYATNSIKSVDNTIGRLMEFQSESSLSLAFEDVNEETYKSFLKWADKEKYGATSINTQIAGWKILATHAREYLNIPVNPWFDSVRFKGLHADVADNIALTDAEIKRLMDLSHLNKEDKNIIYFFVLNCQTGLRFSDQSKLTDDDIDAEGYINIGTEKREKEIAQSLTKLGKQIIKANDGKLPIAPPISTYNKKLKDLCEKAKINGKEIIYELENGEMIPKTYQRWELVSSHTARRTAITNMIANKVDTIDMDALVGAVPATVIRYNKAKPKDVAKKVKSNPYFA